MVLDLSEVPIVGVTAALAIESIVKDSIDRHRHVWIVARSEQVQNRLKKLDLDRFSSQPKIFKGKPVIVTSQLHQLGDRLQALQSALALIQHRSE